MASEIADLFNDPEYSDLDVILTTESVEECRARLARTDGDLGAAPKPTARRGTRAASASSSAEPPGAAAGQHAAGGHESNGGPSHQWELIHGHKVVLCRKSWFFKSARTFKAGSSEKKPVQTQKRKRQSAEEHAGCPDMDVVIFDSLTLEQLPIHRDMIQYMYTSQLRDGIQLSDVVALLRLADFALIDSLKQHCLQQLAAVPFASRSQEDQHLLLSMMDTIVVIARMHPDEPSGEAAAAVEDAAREFLAQSFEETFWQDEANRKLWENLPWEFVLGVLEDDMAIRSEATALVAALSWLRGQRGLQLKEPSSAGEAEQEEGHHMRKEVLEAVRVLQLEPMFFSWLLQKVPEAQELLGDAELAILGEYFMCSEAGRTWWQQDNEQIELWATPRGGLKPDPATVSVSWKKADVLEGISKVANHRAPNVWYTGGTVFSSGLFYKVKLNLDHAAKKEQGTIRVWGGVSARLMVGDVAVAKSDLHKWSCKYGARWGAGATTTVACRNPWGIPVGCRQYIQPNADVEQQLQNWLVDDALVFNATVLCSLS